MGEFTQNPTNKSSHTAESFLNEFYKGTQQKKVAGGWQVCCPAHDDHTPSLMVTDGDKGGVVLFCHAGCETDTVRQAFGATWADILPVKPAGSPQTIEYKYLDEQGVHLYTVVRYLEGGFKQKAADGTWSLKGIPRVPYRLPQLLKATPEDWVWIVEGEKDANRLANFGLIATTNSEGAGKWHKEFGHYFTGLKVIIIPDNDKAGQNHVAQVLENVVEHGAEAVVLTLPGVPPKGDVSDYLNEHTLGDLLDLADAAFASDENALLGEPMLISAQQVHTKAVQWLWTWDMEYPHHEGVIPLGMLTCIVGSKGRGKTNLMEWIAARVSCGELPGVYWGEPQNIAFLSTEDDAADTIVPRYVAMGGDRERLFVMNPGHPFVLSKLDEFGVKIVMMDPASSFLNFASGEDPNNDIVVRDKLEPLRAWAEARGGVVMFVRHPHKGAGRDKNSYLDPGGSGSWVNVPRAVLFFYDDPDRIEINGRQLFARGNHHAEHPGRGGHIQLVPYVTDDGETTFVTTYVMDPEAPRLDEAYVREAAVGSQKEATKPERVAKFLAWLLSSGQPQKIDYCKEALEAAELPTDSNSLKRARKIIPWETDQAAKTWRLS